MNELFSLQDLFNKKIFRIPDYQRGYSWTEQQLMDFWEDIINLQTNREHYTGMIALRKLEEDEIEGWNDENWLIDNWGYKAYHVVDGQQRLTTIVICINELIKFFKNLPENLSKKEENIFINSIPLTEIIKEYLCIVKPDSEEQLKTYKFGYEVDNPSYEFFKYKILEAEVPGDIQETFYTRNLEKAKIFFKETIKENAEKYGISEMEKLFIKLTQRLKFNIYNIENDFNVFVAFETMNNRGKKLSNLELLKNRLIYLTTLFDNNDKYVRKATREKINDTWKTIYGCLGKNKEMALNDDDFLQAHWIMYFGYNRKTKNNYSNFLLNQYFTQKRILSKIETIEFDELREEGINELEDTDEIEENIDEKENIKELEKKLTIGDIGNYADSMKKIIPYWYYMYFPKLSNFSKDIKLWLDRIGRLGFVYFKPLITVILSKNNIEDEKKVEALKAIERFIFMHFRLARYSSTYKNSFFYNLAYSLNNDSENIDYVIKELNYIDYMDKNGQININALNHIFRLFRNYKGYYSWATIRYFLYEYEIHLMDGEANQKIYPEDIFKKDEKDKVSVEHIYPQTPTDEYWLSRFDKYTEEERKFLNGSLGNLLPLSLSINIKLQNDPFDKKKKNRYYKGSYSEIEVSNYQEWNADAILERGIKMLNFMEERWNFKIRNEYDKARLLGVEFMMEKIEDFDVEIDYKKKQNTITNEMVKDVYELAKGVNDNKFSYQDAIQMMTEKGMNNNSASMYIDCFIKMFNGEAYKREVSIYAAEFYINKIREDYGAKRASNAIESLRKHIEYLKEKGYRSNGLEEVLKHQNALNEK